MFKSLQCPVRGNGIAKISTQIVNWIWLRNAVSLLSLTQLVPTPYIYN